MKKRDSLDNIFPVCYPFFRQNEKAKTKRVICRSSYREILFGCMDRIRAERDGRKADEHGFRAAHRTMKASESLTAATCIVRKRLKDRR